VGLGLLIGTAVLRRLFHFDPRDLMIGVCATALTAAGALTALRPWNGTHPPAAFGEPVAALVLVALAAAVAALSGPRSPSDASTGEPAAPPAEG
jgi:hypothetical protein